MPARRRKSFLQGSAKNTAVVYHREHRSKKGRKRKNTVNAQYKYKKFKQWADDLLKEAQTYLNG